MCAICCGVRSTIHIDQLRDTATMTYRGFPVDKVRQQRGKYVAAVLTIIQAWRKAGMLVRRPTALSPSAVRGRTIAGIR